MLLLYVLAPLMVKVPLPTLVKFGLLALFWITPLMVGLKPCVSITSPPLGSPSIERPRVMLKLAPNWSTGDKEEATVGSAIWKMPATLPMLASLLTLRVP